MNKLFTLFLALFFTINFNAQTTPIFWSTSTDAEVQPKGKRQIVPQKYLVFKLIGTQLKDVLFTAPSEKTVKIYESQCIISLPLPNGTFQ
jgi:hypothetical protein